jgi:YjbE family integral membrane protein
MDALSAVLGIVLIDLVLSGDNAVLIGMAAHRLPPQQRRLAILLGGVAAVLLRITLTAAAALLLQIAGLRALGGLVLLWIAFKLLKEEEENSDGVRAAASLRGAVLTILLADFIMSLDNILGVAAASGGNVGLLLFGLILSMAILMFGGSLVAEFINRFVWLAYLGAAVIAWTGASMFLEDPFVARVGVLAEDTRVVATVLVTIAVLVVAHLVHRRPAQGLRR